MPPPPEEQPQILFREDQQFRQPFLWIFMVIGASLVSGTAVFIVARYGGAESSGIGTNPVYIVLAGVVVIAGAALSLILLAMLRLQTEVSTLGLFLRFFPFHRKVRKIDLSNVIRVAPVTYNPVLEYGGYGIRLKRGAKAYNVQGNLGVRIHYENGYHLLIGTRQPEALAGAIQSLLERDEGGL